MKKFIITLALAAMPFVTFAQTNAFAKFEGVEGIRSLTLNKQLFSMIGSIGDSATTEKTKGYLDAASKIDKIKIYSTSESKYKKQLNNAVADYLKANPLDLLLSINDKGAAIKIYVKQGSTESIIKEGLVVVEDSQRKKESTIISFTGELNLNDIKDFKDFKGCKGDKGRKGAK